MFVRAGEDYPTAPVGNVYRIQRVVSTLGIVRKIFRLDHDGSLMERHPETDIGRTLSIQELNRPTLEIPNVGFVPDDMLAGISVHDVIEAHMGSDDVAMTWKEWTRNYAIDAIDESSVHLTSLEAIYVDPNQYLSERVRGLVRMGNPAMLQGQGIGQLVDVVHRQ